LASGRTELWEGKFGAAVHALGRCVEDLEREPVELHAETYGAHPSVAVFIASGLASWFFGLPDQARAHSGLAVERAEKRGRPFDIAAALFQGSRVELLCGHPERAASLAERAETICRDRDVAFFLPGSRFLVGAARVEQGEVDRGLSEMLRELAECRAVNGPFLSDFMLAFIATAYGRNRKWDEGLRRVDEGIRLAATSSDSVYTAELWRIKGELLLAKARAAKSDTSTAGECFRLSQEIARGQEARSLELRTAMSLARLSRVHHGAHQARELLHAVYSSFTEGFDTRDLQDAKALLNDLAADVSEPGL
jgi:predicted ATPase